MRDLLQKHEDLRRAAKQTVTDHQELSGLSEQVLTDVVFATLKKYQQKLNVGIEDSVSDLLDGFKQKITETVFETAGTWQVAVRPPILFPKDCRHCYTRGHSTVVVIEQDPQSRSLTFTREALEEDDDGEDACRRVNLSLPYVVFVLHFRDDVFSGVYCGWRTSPLRDLDDMLCRPLLPNIHSNLAVCMGASGYAVGDNISQQCESVISNFWNSQFNTDLSEMWNSKSLYHRSLDSAKGWEQATFVNPIFVLEFDLPEAKSVQYIIDLLVLNEETPDVSSMRHQLVEQLDNCSERLFSRIMNYFKKTKFDKHFPKHVEDQLKVALQDSVGEFSDLVRCLEYDIDNLRNSVKKSKDIKVEKRSDFWSDYSP